MSGAPYRPGDEVSSGSLYRRAPPDHFPRGVNEPPSKQVFAPNRRRGDSGSSAYLTALTTQEQVLAGHETYGLVEIDVDQVVALGFRVEYSPKPEEPGSGMGHVMIYGDFRASKLKGLRDASRIVRWPVVPSRPEAPPP